MSHPNTREIGIEGEDQALLFLLSYPQGAADVRRRLLARNYRARGGEVDLILEETQPGGATELVFVEVRTLRTPDFPLHETINSRKRHRIELAARRFLLDYAVDYGGRATSIRFDLLTREGDGKWRHWPDAW